MRKVKYLVAALLLMGATTTFTSCIDNDEPAGISDLRGAKAELIRAKAAVETARAAYVEAQTRKANADAETTELNNKIAELNLQIKQAKTEAEIAYYQAELERNQVLWETQLIQNQINLENVKKEYQDLLASLEAADNVMSDAEKDVLADAKSDLQTAYDYQEAAYSQYMAAQKTLNAAYGDFNEDVQKASFERQLEYQQFLLKLKQQDVAYYEAMLNKDFGVTDWEKEISALNDSVADLELQKSAIAEEKTKFVNSEEYRLADKAVTDSKDAYLNDELQADFKYEIPEEIVDDFVSEIGAAYAERYIVEEGTKHYFVATKGTIVTSETEPVKFKEDLDAIIKVVEGRIKDFNTEWDANLGNVDINGEAQLEAAKKAYDAQVAVWKDALAKYNTAKGFDNTAWETLAKVAKKAIEDNYDAANNSSDATKQLAAQNAIAKALVTYYDAVDAKVGLTTITVPKTITIGSVQKEEKKTLRDWLSDATYGGVYWSEQVIGERLSTVDAVIGYFIPDYGTTGGAIEAAGTDQTLLAALKVASQKAFGPCEAYYVDDDNINSLGYLLAQPSLDDVRNAIEENPAVANSLAGAVVAAEDKIADYEDKSTYKESYTALQTALVAEQKVITDRLAELKKAWDDAEAKFTEYSEKVTIYDDKIEAVGETIEAVKNIIRDLKSYVQEGLPEGNSTAEFVEKYTSKLNTAKQNVIAVENEIAKLEEILSQLESGTYNGQMWIEYCKQKVEFAKAVCAEADKLYEDALARLQAVVEALANGAAAE